MIITREFIDSLLDHDNIQKYRDGNVEYIMPQMVKDMAHSLVGLDHIQAIKRVGEKRAEELEEVGDYKERNVHAQLYRALRNEADYGFRVGEKVKYATGERKTRKYDAVILSIDGGQAGLDRFGNVPLILVHKLEDAIEQLEMEI